ncbi:MAG: homocysteine biosynthesis protein, partial [Cyanobacteria bacterium P01_H01_bin.15]
MTQKTRTLAEINDRIAAGQGRVWTSSELKQRLDSGHVSPADLFDEVDVITTGTFEPMESSSAILNLGQSDPPLKIRKCWLDGVPAYAGFGAVDVCLGASMPADFNKDASPELSKSDLKPKRGGGHVIEDLIAGKAISLRAIGQATDCYP